MAFEHNDMNGSLFKNEKGDNPNRPDYTGTAKIFGENVRLAAWIKDGKKGKFMSIQVSQDDGRAKQQAAQPVDDEIPF